GKQLRGRADQVVVKHVNQVSRTRAAGGGHDQRDLRVREHVHEATRPLLGTAREVTIPVKDTVRPPHLITPAAEISGEPVKFGRRYRRRSRYYADAITRPQCPRLHQSHRPTMPKLGG